MELISLEIHIYGKLQDNLHQLSQGYGTNVYSSPALPSGSFGTITIKAVNVS